LLIITFPPYPIAFFVYTCKIATSITKWSEEESTTSSTCEEGTSSSTTWETKSSWKRCTFTVFWILIFFKLIC
jgi:hypothetical protein